MPNQSQILQELLARDVWTLEEQRWMLNYLENNPGQSELEALLQKSLNDNTGEWLDRSESDQILAEIHRRSVTTHQTAAIRKAARLRRLLFRFSAVAALLAGLFWGGAYLLRDNGTKKQSITATQNQDVQPALQGAMLTLSNGQQIRLDSLPDGEVKDAGNISIYKKNGRIIYEQQTADAQVFNTMTTRKGNKYQLVLADGTIVWLNASSSITYPITFSGSERLVNITGEAYFEVAQNREKPFKVIANGTEIQVLGTNFNLNAYTNESQVKATLLEGSIEVKKGNYKALLKPGQQAVIGESGKSIEVVKNADTELAMAWFNNRFLFREADIQTVMRQIARWYDVEIEYTGDIPELLFSGDLSKNNNLKVLIEVLTESGLHVELRGKKITVMP